jgi:short-subunit dehydrogenase
MKLEQSRIVVTGAASGIGRALLYELAQYPVQIVAADVDGRRLTGSAAAIPSAGDGKVTTFTGDMAIPEDVDALFDFAVETMGGIDLFFANAGFGYFEQIEGADWSHIADIYRTNVFSPIYAVEKMRELHPDSDYQVVITGSVMGRLALSGYTLYASTKAALDRFAEGYRLEMGQHGRLTLVYPLAVRTDFFRIAGDPVIPWPSQPAEEVARAMIRGIKKDKKTIYTSWLLPLMLFTLRLLPFTGRLYQRLDGPVVRRWLAQPRPDLEPTKPPA